MTLKWTGLPKDEMYGTSISPTDWFLIYPLIYVIYNSLFRLNRKTRNSCIYSDNTTKENLYNTDTSTVFLLFREATLGGGGREVDLK